MKAFRRFLCNKLDWHKPEKQVVQLRIVGWYCKYCFRDLLKDSQGNWFSVERKGDSNG